MVPSLETTWLGFRRVPCVKLLDKFLCANVRGWLPGIVTVIVMAPLDEVVNGASHFLEVQDPFNFKDFFAVYDLRACNSIFEYRAMMRG